MGAHTGNVWLCHMCKWDLFLNVYFADHLQPLRLSFDEFIWWNNWGRSRVIAPRSSMYLWCFISCRGCNIVDRKCKLMTEMTSSASIWTITSSRLSHCTYFLCKYSHMNCSFFVTFVWNKSHYNTMSSFSHQRDSLFETLFQRSVRIAAYLWLSSLKSWAWTVLKTSPVQKTKIKVSVVTFSLR